MTTNKKTIISIVAIILAVVIASSVAIGIHFARRGNETLDPQIPIGGNPNDDDPGEDLGKGNGQLLVESDIVNMMEVSIANAADDGRTKTLTATVSPSAAPQEVDWSIAFVNPSSTWATGKTVTDYVTVTPASDGSKTATLNCLQAFGEVIKVTCKSRSDASKSAAINVNFVKEPTLSLNAQGQVSITYSGVGTMTDSYKMTYKPVNQTFVTAWLGAQATLVSTRTVTTDIPFDASAYFGHTGINCVSNGNNALRIYFSPNRTTSSATIFKQYLRNIPYFIQLYQLNKSLAIVNDDNALLSAYRALPATASATALLYEFKITGKYYSKTLNVAIIYGLLDN